MKMVESNYRTSNPLLESDIPKSYQQKLRLFFQAFQQLQHVTERLITPPRPADRVEKSLRLPYKLYKLCYYYVVSQCLINNEITMRNNRNGCSQTEIAEEIGRSQSVGTSPAAGFVEITKDAPSSKYELL